MRRRDLVRNLGTAMLASCGVGASTRAPASTRPESRTMRAAMSDFVERGEVPGIVTAVAENDRTDVQELGTRTLGGTDVVRRDTIFRIASMTKPITAAATMMLVEEGRLRLDDPVDRLLPELARPRVLRSIDAPLDDTVPAERAITVRDLLAFTMGIGIVPGHPIQRAMDELSLGQGMPGFANVPAPDAWMRALGSLPLMQQPGEGWLYNTGSDVLGVLVARASGVGFESFLRERIFAPLGMLDTGFSVPDAALHRLATSYAVDPRTGELVVHDRPRNGQWSRPPAFASGAAGLVSTVDDYIAFARMMLDRGRWRDTQLLSEESVAQMTTDQLTPEQKGSFLDAHHGWGFGVGVVLRCDDLGRPAGAFGWDGGLGTSWWCDPDRSRFGVLLTQRAWSSPEPPSVVRTFWDVVDGAC